MARGLNVFVNIGAKVGASVNAAATATERRFAQMGQRLRVMNAEMTRLQSSLEAGAGNRTQGIFEAGMLGYGLLEFMRPAVEFEDALVRVGNTAEVHGRRLDAGGRAAVAAGKKYGIGAREALGALNDFVQSGIQADGMDSFQTAIGMLDPTLMLARTAGVDRLEASQAAIAVVDNLKVSVSELGRAFDIMSKAGKEGRFEIDSMARAFPGLSSRASLLGMKGLDGVNRMAAMLQITRKNARDAEEAENNLLNFLDKLTGNETQQHFSKLGVDIGAMFKKSQETGADFVDMMLDEIGRLTKDGSDAIALTKLFPDRQARQAALALLQHRKEYERIKDASRAASGVLEADWKRISGTTRTSLGRFRAAIESLAITIGSTLLPALASGAEWLAKVAGKVALWAERNPGLTKAIVGVTAALIGLRVVGLVVVWLFGGLATMALRLGTGLFKLGGFIGSLLMRFAPLRIAMIAARYGFAAAAVTAWPLALAIGALGVAVAWIVSKWSGFKAFFDGMKQGFADAVGPEGMARLQTFGSVLAGAFRIALLPLELLRDALGAVFGWLGSLFAPAETEKWKSAGEAFGAVIGGMTNKVMRFIEGLKVAITAVRNLFTMRPAGDLPDLGNPSGDNFGAGGVGRRARGGGVTRGSLYQINEQGQELFAPGRSGTIIPAKATAALIAALSGGIAVAPAQAGGDTIHLYVQGAGDPNAVAEAVMKRLEQKARREQSARMND
jgi:TP901 family phage tail tape measure protein